eukprot:365342-Chlamydomonas_euryale.AAC.1
MSGRCAAQSSRLKRVLGASKQRAEAHQSNKAPVDAEGWDSSHSCSRVTVVPTVRERVSITFGATTRAQKACERQISAGCGPSAGSPTHRGMRQQARGRARQCPPLRRGAGPTAAPEHGRRRGPSPHVGLLPVERPRQRAHIDALQLRGHADGEAFQAQQRDLQARWPWRAILCCRRRPACSTGTATVNCADAAPGAVAAASTAAAAPAAPAAAAAAAAAAEITTADACVAVAVGPAPAASGAAAASAASAAAPAGRGLGSGRPLTIVARSRAAFAAVAGSTWVDRAAAVAARPGAGCAPVSATPSALWRAEPGCPA